MALALFTDASAQDKEQPLWPNGTPGAKGDLPRDIPTLTPFLAPAGNNSGSAIVICPGGGYGGLASHEGATYAQFLQQQGINGFVLKYRLGSAGYRHPIMLGDAARALRTVRANAKQWKIDPDKIRDVIGKGGAVIRGITEDTGASVDIDDDGNVRIYGEDSQSRDAALEMVNAITAEAEVGKLYNGKVARIVDFGAFVTILPGKDGLVHISQISKERVENVNEYLQEGQDVLVKCTDLDARGRIKLSIKEITEEEKAEFAG